jgi:5-methylcytosine-specific restriction endonuclease McrA
VYNAQRRIRRLAAQIDGPLPRKVYLAILASGPCVYCGDPAVSIDHVRPLSRGGLETEGNLVPACAHCNSTKHARLLTEWDPVRVAYGAVHSPAVAAELDREMAQVLMPPHWV